MTKTRIALAIIAVAILACGNATPSNTSPTRARVDTPAAEAPAQPVETEAPTEAAAAYTTGQDVQVGEVRWKITEVKDLGQELKSDNEFIEPKTTGGKFVSVSFEMENQGAEQKTFAGLSLIDGKGRKFEAYSEAFGFVPTDKACIFENINPGLSKQCVVIFELPGDAAGLSANVGDLEIFGGSEALIDLGF